MKTIGIADDKQKEIFQYVSFFFFYYYLQNVNLLMITLCRVLAAILHIGNINFEFMKDTDSVIVKNEKGTLFYLFN